MSMNDFINMLNKEQKLALLKALQDDGPSIAAVPKEVKQESVEHIEKQTNSNNAEDFRISFIKKDNHRRKEPVKANKNKWVDEGEDRHIETKYGSRTPRTREPSKKIDVECSVCGRSFKADPKYVYGEYHRCSRCTGR